MFFRCIRIFGLVMVLAACSADEEAGQASESRDEWRQMTMTICLQPDVDLTAAADPSAATSRRAEGDPGTVERMRYPRYFYIYPVAFTNVDGDDSPLDGGNVCPMKDGDGKECNRIDVTDDAAQWARYLMTVDPPQTLMDSVYGSRQSITFKVTPGVKLMRFYVAASWVPLKCGGVELGVNGSVLKENKNEDDVLALTFDADDAATQAHLQDIYSSPYNYKPGGIYRNEYYYTIFDPDGGGDITRIIYHVAAKVDVMWNVAKAKQHDLRVTHVEARQLKQKNCLLFRPTENTWTTDDDSHNYNLVLMDNEDNDISRQWYGREYYYTIPYTIPYGQYFYTHLHLLKNGEAGDGFNVKLKKDLSPPAFSVFTPWLRTDLNITSDMSYSATEIEIDI